MNRKHVVLMLAVALTIIALAAFLSRSGQAQAPDPSGFGKPEGSTI